jgi:hypothetical protein
MAGVPKPVTLLHLELIEEPIGSTTAGFGKCYPTKFGYEFALSRLPVQQW